MSNGARIKGFVVGTVSLTVTDLGAGVLVGMPAAAEKGAAMMETKDAG